VTPLYNIQQARDLEAHCLSQVPEGELIHRAAQALSVLALKLLDELPKPARVLTLIGPGNNGADAQLCGQLLGQKGQAVESISLDSLEAFDLESAAFSAFIALIDERCLVVDGLFGLGLKRSLSVKLAAIFRIINTLSCKVLAVDLPSGLNGNTGLALGAALRADHTVTMLVDKVGLHTGEAVAYVGEIHLETLGCEEALGHSEVKPDAYLIAQAWLKSKIPYRSRLAHKGSHGSVLVIGGAPGMRGAALLAALGAQAGGAGKVFVYFFQAQAAETFALSMLHPGLLLFQLDGQWEDALKKFDAVVIGCGLGQSDQARELVSKLLSLCELHQKPLVLDADALNLIALKSKPDESVLGNVKKASRAWVMTPHPLEAARLLGSSTPEVQADRIPAAQSLAEKYDCSVALKGPGSVIASPRSSDDLATSDFVTTSIAPFGSPCLAVGGTGDVLAGLIGSLLAQGFQHRLAAQMGTSIHALAGSLWGTTREKSYGLRPEELPSFIVKIMNEV
jgi:ADP-dependent NAD(P)H-hydrate dehydratase / NAD(P)H-hydrate epimerase